MRIQCQGKGENVFRKLKYICIKFSFQSPYEKRKFKRRKKKKHCSDYYVPVGPTSAKPQKWASGPTPAPQSVRRARRGSLVRACGCCDRETQPCLLPGDCGFLFPVCIGSVHLANVAESWLCVACKLHEDRAQAWYTPHCICPPEMHLPNTT